MLKIMPENASADEIPEKTGVFQQKFMLQIITLIKSIQFLSE